MKNQGCYFPKTYYTMGKTDIHEGVIRETEGLFMSFDIK